MDDIASENFTHERGKAKLNRTVAALMQRGVDLHKARELDETGFTLAQLKGLDATKLKDLGLSDAQAAAIHAGRRAVLPFANLAKVL